MIDESSDVMTREAEEVNDFTTDDKYFSIPTVINPIKTVLYHNQSNRDTSLL